MESVVIRDDLKAYFKGKKVFITGHTGFKGSWLTAMLYQLGAIVKGYALTPDDNTALYHTLSLEEICQSSFGDIRDRRKLSAEIASFSPDYVFHLAAQPLVRRSYQIPAETFDVNVVGTANLLDSLRLLQNKCTCVVITTDKVYENREQDILYNEEDKLGGYDPYSASKACTELVAGSFRNSFFNLREFDQHRKALLTARAGNVIGGGDWSVDRIIPDVVRSLEQNRSIEVRNPAAVRPWQHVLEPLSGYLLLAALADNEPLTYQGAFNFGPHAQDHLTVCQMVEIAIKAWGQGSWHNAHTRGQPHEAELLKLDISKSMKLLNWSPKLDCATSVQWTIDWYKQSKEQQKAFTFSQIDKYLAL